MANSVLLTTQRESTLYNIIVKNRNHVATYIEIYTYKLWILQLYRLLAEEGENAKKLAMENMFKFFSYKKSQRYYEIYNQKI